MLTALVWVLYRAGFLSTRKPKGFGSKGTAISECIPMRLYVTKPQLRKDLSLATGTMSKLNKGEDVALSVLLRICEYLDCDIGDICEAVRVEKA